MSRSKIPYCNIEGYADPTPHGAMTNIEREKEMRYAEADDRNTRLIRAIKAIVDLAGFDLVGRITLQDRKTGRIYK